MNDEWEERRQAYLRSAAEMIKQHGWMVQVVGSGDGEPSFHYTIGLCPNDKGPEFIIFGLPYVVGGKILNELGRRASEGARFTHGQILNDLFGDDVPALIVDVDDVNGHFGTAQALYPGLEFFAQQVIFPDENGRWPWQGGPNAKMPVLSGSASTLGL